MKRVTHGGWLFAIGLVHQLFGLLAGLGLLAAPDGTRRNLYAEIAHDGLIGAVERDPMRSALFWFLAFGFLLLILGSALHTVERAGHPVPRALGWQLAALGLCGGLFIPASGFWLVLPVAWRIHRQRPSPSGSATAAARSARSG
jgi:hypothetical protein